MALAMENAIIFLIKIFRRGVCYFFVTDFNLVHIYVNVAPPPPIVFVYIFCLFIGKLPAYLISQRHLASYPTVGRKDLSSGWALTFAHASYFFCLLLNSWLMHCRRPLMDIPESQ
jgi:hypothetical protein